MVTSRNCPIQINVVSKILICVCLYTSFLDSAHIMKYSSPNRTTGSTCSSTNGILEDHLNIYTETDMMKFRHSFLRVCPYFVTEFANLGKSLL